MPKAPVIASDLRHRVRVDYRPATEGDGGSGVGDWTVFCTRWAAIRPLMSGAGDAVMGDRLAGKQPALLILRRDSVTKNIVPGMRAVRLVKDADGETYFIRNPFDMEQDNRFVTLVAVYGDADG